MTTLWLQCLDSVVVCANWCFWAIVSSYSLSLCTFRLLFFSLLQNNMICKFSPSFSTCFRCHIPRTMHSEYKSSAFSSSFLHLLLIYQNRFALAFTSLYWDKFGMKQTFTRNKSWMNVKPKFAASKWNRTILLLFLRSIIPWWAFYLWLHFQNR